MDVFNDGAANGRKSTEADMQGDVGDVGSSAPASLEHFGGEMQPGSWGSDGSAILGEHCLVTLAIYFAWRAVDVRRQRDFAGAVDQVSNRSGALEA